MNRINITLYKSSYGELVLGSFDGCLCLCDWHKRKMRNIIDQRVKKHLNAEFIERRDNVLIEVINQLEEYFSSNRRIFEIPLITSGTSFQNKIWDALKIIPYGETKTYKDVASIIQHDNAIRAVGYANSLNALALFIPCHRVIGANGELTGYSGGIQTKQKLLELENNS